MSEFTVTEMTADFDRTSLRDLFHLADDSDQAIAHYMHDGRLFVLQAGAAGAAIGHLLVTPGPAEAVAELKSVAILPAYQGQGLGRKLVTTVVTGLWRQGVRRVLVGTSTADIDNLAFYQKLGFRFHAVERDVFTPAHGYPPDHVADGIPVRDRIWLDLERDGWPG